MLRLAAHLAALSLVACNAREAPTELAEPEPAAAPLQLLGVLQRMGQCTRPEGQDDERWVGQHWAVGFVPLHVPAALEPRLAPHHGRPVLVTGVPAGGPPPEAAVQVTEPCPTGQARSDWVASPDGTLLRRGPAPLRGLSAADVRPWTGLRASVQGDALALEWTHDLGDAPLDPAELVAHYEGCYGAPGAVGGSGAKMPLGGPGANTESVPLGALAPGASAHASVPLRKYADIGREPGPQPHVLASVELRARAEGVVVALDVPLHLLGVAPVECP